MIVSVERLIYFKKMYFQNIFYYPKDDRTIINTQMIIRL